MANIQEVNTSVAEKPEIIAADFPDNTQLPDSDGTFVKNFQ
jgi:hypothetical protein